MKRYAVKEMFLTLQGEGQHAGRRAVFIRFAGCNVWSGREEDRERDAAKGVCARWCDTDFVGTDGEGGGRFEAQELAARALLAWDHRDMCATAVITGGEPSLQLNDALVDELHLHGFAVHVETNGARPLPLGVDWVTLSPKPPCPVTAQRYDEVKVVGPGAGVDPLQYQHLARLLFLQPLDQGDNARREANMKAAVDFVMTNPRWRLSLQTHKLIGLP